MERINLKLSLDKSKYSKLVAISNDLDLPTYSVIRNIIDSFIYGYSKDGDQKNGTVSIPFNRTIHFLRSSDLLIICTEEIAMRKARFTEYQLIAVLKSVEAGRAVKDVCRETGISEAIYYSWKDGRMEGWKELISKK